MPSRPRRTLLMLVTVTGCVAAVATIAGITGRGSDERGGTMRASSIVLLRSAAPTGLRAAGGCPTPTARYKDAPARSPHSATGSAAYTPQDLGDLHASAELIVDAQVLSARDADTAASADLRRARSTSTKVQPVSALEHLAASQLVTLQACHTYRGRAGTTIRLRRQGDAQAQVEADAPYGVGERYLLFLRRRQGAPDEWMTVAPAGRMYLRRDGSVRSLDRDGVGAALDRLPSASSVLTATSHDLPVPAHLHTQETGAMLDRLRRHGVPLTKRKGDAAMGRTQRAGETTWEWADSTILTTMDGFWLRRTPADGSWRTMPIAVSCPALQSDCDEVLRAVGTWRAALPFMQMPARTARTPEQFAALQTPTTVSYVVRDMGDTGWRGMASLSACTSTVWHGCRGASAMTNTYMPATAAPVDLQAIACQELGHVMGLGHAPGDCMGYTYFQSSSNSVGASSIAMIRMMRYSAGLCHCL